MHKSKQNKVPFGTVSKRFTSLGCHPNLDKSGGYLVKSGPEAYDYYPERPRCWYKDHSLKDSWTRKVEMEEYSRCLGYKNANILEERKEAATKGGPTYELTNEVYKRKDHRAYDNVSFGIGDRFPKILKNVTPDPGAYGYVHKELEKHRKPHKQWTKVPLFEWSGFGDRFKTKPVAWSIPANRYDVIVDGSITATLAKQVTKRGPYDCFTGPRDNTTIHNYFSTGMFKGANTWLRLLPCEIDKLKNPDKSQYGKFLKGPRFSNKGVQRNMLTDIVLCYKNPKEPGPAQYDVSTKTKYKKNLHPFNSSVPEVRPVFTESGLPLPGPGKYSAVKTVRKKPKRIKIKKPSLVPSLSRLRPVPKEFDVHFSNATKMLKSIENLKKKL